MMPTSASTTKAGEECRMAPVSTLILREGSNRPLFFPQMPYVQPMNLCHMWCRCPLTCCFCAGSQRECVHEPFKWGVSVSFSPLDLLVFKARYFGDLSLWYRSQELGCLMQNLNLLLLMDVLCICEITLACGSSLHKWGFWPYCISACFTCLIVVFLSVVVEELLSQFSRPFQRELFYMQVQIWCVLGFSLPC